LVFGQVGEQNEGKDCQVSKRWNRSIIVTKK